MKFIEDEDALTIRLEGAEQFWGLRRRIMIPRSKVTSLTWHPQYLADVPIVRFAGTAWPGVLYAGHFRTNGKWAFLYLNRPQGWAFVGGLSAQNVLVITAQDYPYGLVLVSCEPDIGASLLNWWTEVAS